ncbi:MAG TPA: dihydrofolate reductase family protein, partial [Phycisphaerales bacterium]|nr:dihydrofolate reductase family protein [Phycisphaerales bacterium]
RVIIDLHLRTPASSKIVQTAHQFPTIIACDASLESSAEALALTALGVQLLPIPPHNSELPLEPVLRELANRFDVSTVLVEGGPGLVTRLFRQKLVNLAWVFIAPLILGDQHAPGIITGVTADKLTDGTFLKLTSLRRRGQDMMATCVPNP